MLPTLRVLPMRKGPRGVALRLTPRKETSGRALRIKAGAVLPADRPCRPWVAPPRRPRAMSRRNQMKVAAPQAAGASLHPARPAHVARRRRPPMGERLMRPPLMRPTHPPSPRPPAVASPRPAPLRAMLSHRPPLAFPTRLGRPPRLARQPHQGKMARGLAPRKSARPVPARNRRRPARVRPFPERRPRMARRIRRRPRRLRVVVPGWSASSSTRLGSLARPRALPARIAPRALARHGYHGRFSSVGRATAL